MESHYTKDVSRRSEVTETFDGIKTLLSSVSVLKYRTLLFPGVLLGTNFKRGLLRSFQRNIVSL